MGQMQQILMTAKGPASESLEVKETGETGFTVLESEIDAHFEAFAASGDVSSANKLLEENKVCFKQKVASVKHPFQTKTEWDWVIVKIPFNGTIKEKVRPRLYRRDVEYVVAADICYPVDLVIKNVERCAKQAAIAAAATALTGNLAATKAGFATAFLACMALSDFPNADQIDIRVYGDTMHGEWVPV